jgi:penicillin-binding protein 1A
MRPPQYPPPRKPRKRRARSLLLTLLGYGFAAVVVLFLVATAVVGYLLYTHSRDLPDYESLARYEPPVMTRIHAHDGSLIAEFARERRIFVPINTIPKPVIDAFLSAEDKRFYEHGGLDFGGMIRAVVNNARNGFRGGLQGASTITQQVAKNFLLSSEQKLERKIKEAILAVRIERAYTKDRILELYLNEIYFGINSYGVAAAALNYFNKELKDLEPHEFAYLAALPKAPNNYHPFRSDRTRKRALERRNWILDQMVVNGHLDAAKAAEAKKKDLGVNPRPFGTHISTAEFFAEEVRRTLLSKFGEDKLYAGGMSVRTTLNPRLQQIARQALTDGLVRFDRQKGWRGPVSKIDTAGDWGVTLAGIEVPHDIQPWRLGVVLEVQKTKAVIGLRPPRQTEGAIAPAREAVEIGIDEVKWAGKPMPPRPDGTVRKADVKAVSDVLTVGDVVYVAPKDRTNLAGVWSLMQIPEIGGGLVAMDPHTGRVLAVAGGFSHAISQFDRAMQARRQPGSVFKPLVYAAAIDNGYKPSSIVLDAPIEVDQGPGKEAWNPQNYEEGKYGGPSTLRIGIEKSRNQMTVRLAQDMGMPLVQEYARRFGVYDELLPVLAMSLGAGETTLLKMTTAYCMLANGGRQVQATLIDRIQDRWGKPIWRHDDRACPDCTAQAWNGQSEPDVPDARPQVVDPHTAYQMTSIMEGVVLRGTATVIREKFLPGVPVAGKTGTTNDEKDAWFVGYTPDLVVGVYMGYDTPRPMGKGMTGGSLAAPVFGDFVKQALGDKPPVPFRIPPDMKLVRIDLKTGLRVTPGEPPTQTIQEAFKPGEEPDDQGSAIGLTSAPVGQSSVVTPSVTAGRGGLF